MTADDIRQLFAYNKWANDRTLASLDQLSAEEFTRPLGSSHSSVRDTAAHIAGGEWVWLSRWKGQSPRAMPDSLKDISLPSLKAMFADLEAERAEYLSQLADDAVTRVVTFTLFSGAIDHQPLGAQLQHLVNHGTYHRGQLAGMLRQLNATPVSTDFIRWIRERGAT